MPYNIEIKALLKNRPHVETIAARLSDAPAEVIEQDDIFFRCEGARLKLRIFSPQSGELIRYRRADIADARCSTYAIARIADPLILLQMLSETLGVVGRVKKTRTLYLIGQTRVHFDEVSGLGNFLELEVVLRSGQPPAKGIIIAERLRSELEVDRNDLIAEAYIDLLSHTQSHI